MTDPTATTTEQARNPMALAFVAGAYLAALGVAWGVAHAMPQVHPLWAVLAADLAGTVVVFAFSVAFNNSSFYDPYWSVAPLFIAPFLVARSGLPISPRAVLVVALVYLWGLRLTYNWMRGWEGLKHEDWRYSDFRTKAPRAYWLVSFVGFHSMPTMMVFLGCFGLCPALAAPRQPLGWLDAVAAAVTLGAVLVEATADAQLHRFCASKKPGEIMARGLWAYSRHPNYFGEVSFWWGIWLCGVAADPASALWTFAGPAAITLLFVFISVPLLDKRSLARRPGYAEHIRRVSALLPWPARTD